MSEQPGELIWESNFVRQMKRFREARNMTQTDMARALKGYGLPFHQQTVQRVEMGERPVRLNEAMVIATILQVDLMSLIGDAAIPDEVVDRVSAAPVLRDLVKVLRDHGVIDQQGAES